MSQDPAEQNIQMWKVKKLIRSLEAAKGYVAIFSAKENVLIVVDPEQEPP